MSVQRSTWSDDDGSGKTGTVINNAELQKIYNNIDAYGTSFLITTATGTVNNLPLGAPAAHIVLRCSNGATPLTITGFSTTAPSSNGDRLTLYASGAPVYLAHYSANSTIKMWNMAQSGPSPIHLVGSASFIYHDGAWLMIYHEQGAWIAAPYLASDYYAAAGTWTVTAGNIVSVSSHLAGKTLAWQVSVINTVVGGTPSGLYRKLFGFNAARTVDCWMAGYNAGTERSSHGVLNAGTPEILWTALPSGGAWAAGGTHVYSAGTVEVS